MHIECRVRDECARAWRREKCREVMPRAVPSAGWERGGEVRRRQHAPTGRKQMKGAVPSPATPECTPMRPHLWQDDTRGYQVSRGTRGARARTWAAGPAHVVQWRIAPRNRCGAGGKLAQATHLTFRDIL